MIVGVDANGVEVHAPDEILSRGGRVAPDGGDGMGAPGGAPPEGSPPPLFVFTEAEVASLEASISRRDDLIRRQSRVLARLLGFLVVAAILGFGLGVSAIVHVFRSL